MPPLLLRHAHWAPDPRLRSSVSLQGKQVLGASLLLGKPGTLPSQGEAQGPSSRRIRGVHLSIWKSGSQFENEWNRLLGALGAISAV